MVPESKNWSSFISLNCSPKFFRKTVSPNPNNAQPHRQPGGWKTMPYILGNETFERLASIGLLANFMIYLTRVYHMNQVSATSLINLWSGVTDFLPLIGAFLSDAYFGRYSTIAVASFASLLGMSGITLTAWLPELHPPACTSPEQSRTQCKPATPSQLAFLITSLSFVSLGTAGIRPCSIPFGVDQFDPTTDKGRKGISSFYNWYYVTFTIILILTSTVVVYIQDSVSWVLGYGIPTILMFFSILLFFFGTRVYVYVKPEGSVFTGLAQVIVASYKKRKLKLPSHGGFYDPPLSSATSVLFKLPLTQQFSFLNKAAIVGEKEVNSDGSRVNKWSLCSIQQVEELKCLVRVGPIWLTGIISLVPLLQQFTFSVSQALQMDRHLGPKFEIPAGSLSVISFLTIAVWIPIYDRFVVPALRKITNHKAGISPLQRMGVGIIFAVLSMIAAALTERKRRSSAAASEVPITVFWLSPQFILMGLCEGFNIIGQIEFFNAEFPEHMRTIANALSSCSFALSAYISTFFILTVHKTTSHGGSDWLADDLNAAKLDYFYFLIAATAFLNFFLFLYCARNYRYKGSGEIQDLELIPAAKLAAV